MRNREGLHVDPDLDFRRSPIQRPRLANADQCSAIGTPPTEELQNSGRAGGTMERTTRIASEIALFPSEGVIRPGRMESETISRRS